MHPTCRSPLRLSALSLAIALGFATASGAHAQQILYGGGDGGGLNFNSGRGGIGGGGGGAGSTPASRGGNAVQTLEPWLQPENGQGPGGGQAAFNGVAGGAGGGSDSSGWPGGAGGIGTVTNQAYFSVLTGLNGSNGGNADSSSPNAAGGGGGGAGLVSLGQNATIELNNAFLRGGSGGATTDIYAITNGGGGGAGLVLARGGTIRLSGNSQVTGGDGGASADLIRSAAGSGGAGIFLYDGGTLIVAGGLVRGGAGGSSPFLAGNAAAGVLSNLGQIRNAGTISGGAAASTREFYGRPGGVGIQAWGGTITNDATGLINGGEGGSTGYDSAASVSGTGGAAVSFLAGQAASLVNAGRIHGGAGGDVYANSKVAGAGGVGISGAATGNISIINNGAIAGGMSNDGKRANAIELAGSGNRLELQPGAIILGNVVVAEGGADNVLALGGDGATGTFDVTQIGADQRYSGFDRYEKTGSGAWVLTGTGNQDWTVRQGDLSGNSASIAGNVTFTTGANGTLTFNQAIDGAYDGAISGDGKLVKAGVGTLTLTGSNAYTGGTVVAGGTLALNTPNPAGSISGAIDVGARLEFYSPSTGISLITIASGASSTHFYSDANAGDTRLINNGLLGFHDHGSASRANVTNNGNLFFFDNSTAGSATITNTSRVNFLGHADGGNAKLINGAGAIVDFSQSIGVAGDGKLSIGQLTGEGRIFLGSNTLTIGGGADATELWSVIADGGNAGGAGASLIKAGSDTLILRGRNGYTGSTTVRGGTLQAGVADALSASSALNVESAGTFSIGGYDVAVSALSGAGLVTNTDGALRTLTVDGAQNSTFSGRLADSQSAGLSLTKRGSGRLILSGSNTYAGYARGERGQTAIYGGTLQFGDGASASVNQLGGDLFVHENGALAISGKTTVAVANDVNLIGNNGAGAVLSITANANGPSLTADRVIIGADATFNLSGIDGPLVQDRLLIDTRGGIQGEFATLNIGGFAGAVDYLAASTRKSTDGKQYLATYGLSWTANNSLAGGTFTLADAGNRFTVGAALADQAANAATGWNGKSLTKAGNGTLILTGANTYSGGTTITGGTLQLGDGGNTGSISGNVVNQGMLAFNRGDTFTFAGDISGNGALRQSGSGTTVLTGANTHTGGTLVDGGTLRAGSSGAFAARTAYVVNGGTLDLNNHDLTMSALSGAGGTVALGTATLTVDQSIDTAYAGAITGSGDLIKLGTGTLTLTGVSAMNLRLASGAMVTHANALRGNAALAAGTSLAFDQPADAAYGGQLSGQGDLRKLGAGKLDLTGDSSAFAGATTIQAGTLAVNGKLGGTLDVGAAGRLQGNGSVGDTAVSGTVAPGNSIGTLNVAGNLVFNPGSTYEAEVDAAGRSDRIIASGAATINGGAVQVVAGAGNYASLTRYTLLTANGGRTGEFSGVTSNQAFLSPTLGYDANNVYLTLTRNQIGFQDVGATPNQAAAGGGAERLGQGNALHDALLGLSAQQARAAFDQLSGEVHASIRTALIEDSRYLRDAVNDRVRAAFDGGGYGAAPGVAYENGQPRALAAGAERAALWSQAFGAWAQTRGNTNAARLNRSTGGFLAGADAPVSQHWRLGAVAGYSRTGFNVKDRQSSGSSDNYHLGLYGGAQWRGLALRAGASHTWHDLSTRRDVDFPGFSDRLKGGYRAGTTQVFGELAYQIRAGGAGLEPYANVAHVKLRTHGFTERGGAAALSAAAASTDTTFTTLGLRAATALDLKGAPLTLRGMAGWRHAFGDATPLATMRFAGGGAFAVSGVPLARDTAVLEAGLDYAVTARTTLGLAYNGQLGAGLSDHGVKASFTLRF